MLDRSAGNSAELSDRETAAGADMYRPEFGSLVKPTGNLAELPSPLPKDILPRLEIGQINDLKNVCRSAAGLGETIEGRINTVAFIPKQVSPKQVSFNIGVSNPPSYYEKYSAGLSATVSSATSTSDGFHLLSAGASAGYSNPNIDVHLYAQPVAGISQYGFKFATNF